MTVITDNMAGGVMFEGKIDGVFVGSDRIARNGDVCNKIGTYSVAVLAKEHGIPFYAVAPLSTFDRKILHGDQIPIEERPASEITAAGADEAVEPPCRVVLEGEPEASSYRDTATEAQLEPVPCGVHRPIW